MHKSIYKDLNNNTWYIHTSIKGKSVTIRGFKSKKDANENYEIAIEKWKRDHNLYVSDDTFEKIAIDYVEYVRTGKSSRTADRERTQLNTFWLPRLQGQPLYIIFNRERLKIIYREIKEDTSMNVRKKHDVVYTFLQLAHYCYVNHYISGSVYEDITVIFQPIHYVKAVKQERRVIPQCDLRSFLAVLSHEKQDDVILFTLLVSCGLRISELLGLCGDCIINNKAVIKRQLLVNGTLSDKLKTKQSYRSVPLPKDLFKDFELTDGRLFNISHTQFKRKLYALEDKAGIDHYMPHEFRHTKCYELAKKCENMSDVVYCSKVMGHSTSVFLNTYCSHLDESLEAKFF